MGLIPFLRGVLGIPEAGISPSYSANPATVSLHYSPRTSRSHQRQPRIDIYGPAGLRIFVRQNMKMTFTNTAETYAVHELLLPGDPSTPCDPPPPTPTFDYHIAHQNVMHISEAPGLDIRPGSDGFWRQITRGPGRGTEVVVDAGPIQHRGEYAHLGSRSH